MPADPKRKHRIHWSLRLGAWIIGGAGVLSIYSFATRPDDPLDRLKDLRIVDDHKVIDGRMCSRIIKVQEDEVTTAKSVAAALTTSMPWYPKMYKPRPMGDYCTYTSADGKYDITVTPGGSGVYTQISESRPAGSGERMSGWFQDVVDRFSPKRA